MAVRRKEYYIDDWILLEKIVLIIGVNRFEGEWHKIADFMTPLFKDYLHPEHLYTADKCAKQYYMLVEKYVDENNSEPRLIQISEHIKALCKKADDPTFKEEEFTRCLKKFKVRIGNTLIPSTIKYGKHSQAFVNERKQKIIEHIKLHLKRDCLKKESEESVIEKKDILPAYSNELSKISTVAVSHAPKEIEIIDGNWVYPWPYKMDETEIYHIKHPTKDFSKVDVLDRYMDFKRIPPHSYDFLRKNKTGSNTNSDKNLDRIKIEEEMLELLNE